MNPWLIDYQANNHPVEFVQETKRIACTYDHMGRRVEKAAWNNNTLTKRQRYIYNGYVQIAEIDATNEETPQVVKTYLWDPSEPVATRILHMTAWNNGVEVESLYYTHDLQKNVTALFGQAAGRRAQYEHDPYGNPINTTGDAAGQNPYRYSSEYHDEDLGLIYYNYRHYNPTDGRWINCDPIAEQGGINLYGFVGNRAGWFGDRLGLQQTNVDILRIDDLGPDKNGNSWCGKVNANADGPNEKFDPSRISFVGTSLNEWHQKGGVSEVAPNYLEQIHPNVRERTKVYVDWWLMQSLSAGCIGVTSSMFGAVQLNKFKKSHNKSKSDFSNCYKSLQQAKQRLTMKKG